MVSLDWMYFKWGAPLNEVHVFWPLSVHVDPRKGCGSVVVELNLCAFCAYGRHLNFLEYASLSVLVLLLLGRPPASAWGDDDVGITIRKLAILPSARQLGHARKRQEAKPRKR